MSRSNRNLRYPLATFQKPEVITNEHIQSWIKEIENFPKLLRAEVLTLNEEQMSWPYRPDGWNIRQVVHHCADSHMNCLIRFKLALTEDNPTIRPYAEDRWALLPDMKAPVQWSLQLLEALHQKWAYLLRQMRDVEYERTFVHPEYGSVFTLKEALGMYAWHGNHHLAHVKQAIKYQGRFDLA